MNNNTKCDLALRIRPLKAALQISFRDIQFISAYHDKILLPYTGDLPQVIQQYIINDALETCYTVKEMLLHLPGKRQAYPQISGFSRFLCKIIRLPVSFSATSFFK